MGLCMIDLTQGVDRFHGQVAEPQLSICPLRVPTVDNNRKHDLLEHKH